LERKTVSAINLLKKGTQFISAPLLVDEDFATYSGTPLIAKGQVNGVLEVYHRSPFEPDENWLEFFKVLAGQTAIAVDSANLFTELRLSNTKLFVAYDSTIEGWSHALDLRDKETEGHTQRVTEMTMKLARAAGITEEELVHVRRGALLHDIGKMGVPDHILLKPGKLTDEEWVVMRKHTTFAFELLSPIAYLRPALDIPYCHHEKWDGSGYPRGLKGEQIPLVARLFSIVDVWDALLSDRPYRQGWPKEKVIEHIKSLSGTHFDPKAVELFLKVLNEDEKNAG
jgi:putative nucleotidyltransferase with HDIG domain